MFTKIRNYILAGFIIVLPLFISIVVLSWIFIKLTNVTLHILPQELAAHPILNIAVRILVLFAILVFFALVGLITRMVFVRQLFTFGEKILVKIPLFNKVYIAVKQISTAFLSSQKSVFNRVVLVEYPRKGLYSVGFITSINKGEIQSKTHNDVVNVFVPTTPNPTSGVLVFARKKEIIELNMTVEEGFKFIVSGGTVTSPYGDKI